MFAVKPWTTYELATQMERTLNRMWPRARSKLYEEPKKLVAHGLAKASKERTGKRPRTVYSIRSSLRCSGGTRSQKASTCCSAPIFTLSGTGTVATLPRSPLGDSFGVEARLHSKSSKLFNAAARPFSGLETRTDGSQPSKPKSSGTTRASPPSTGRPRMPRSMTSIQHRSTAIAAASALLRAPKLC